MKECGAPDVIESQTESQQRRQFRTRLIAVAAGSRPHGLWVLLGAILAFLIPMGPVPTSRYVLGSRGQKSASTPSREDVVGHGDHL